MDRGGRAAAAIASQLTARLPLVKSGHDRIGGCRLRALCRATVRQGESAQACAVHRSPPASLAQEHLRVLLARQRGHEVRIRDFGARRRRVWRQGARHKKMPCDNGGDRPLRSAAAQEALRQCRERHCIEAPRESALPSEQLRVRQAACKRTAVAGHRSLPHVRGRARVRGCLINLWAQDERAAVGRRQHGRCRRVLQELQPRLRIEPPVARHHERIRASAAHARCAAPDERATAATILHP